MSSQPIITYRNMDSSPSIDQRIKQKTTKLQQIYPRMLGCEVIVNAPQKRVVSGRPFEVSLTVRIPGNDIHVSRTVGRGNAAEDVNHAINEVFEIARRELHEHRDKHGTQEHKRQSTVIPDADESAPAHDMQEEE